MSYHKNFRQIGPSVRVPILIDETWEEPLTVTFGAFIYTDDDEPDPVIIMNIDGREVLMTNRESFTLARALLSSVDDWNTFADIPLEVLEGGELA